MDDSMYKHVLFKDLYPYLKRTDYLSGFSSVELSYIRKNIGAIGQLELAKASKMSILENTYLELLKLKKSSSLHPGLLYIIKDYQTIYSSTLKNNEGKYITWGLDINPSKISPIIITAYSTNSFMPNGYIINDDSTCTLVNYIFDSEILDDGISTKGSITYMVDLNRNEANFDFKNLLIIKDSKYYHLFSDLNGNDNSLNCYFNNCCNLQNSIFVGNIERTFIKGANNFILANIKNMLGELSNVTIIKDEIGLSNESNKNIIRVKDNYYIDYLDFDTLTHQFYACG